MKTPSPIVSSRDIRNYYRGFEDALRLNAAREGRFLMIGGKKLSDILKDLADAKKLALANANDEMPEFATLEVWMKYGVAVGHVKSRTEAGVTHLVSYKPETEDVMCTCLGFKFRNPRPTGGLPNFPKANQPERFCHHLKKWLPDLLQMAKEGDLDNPREFNDDSSLDSKESTTKPESA